MCGVSVFYLSRRFKQELGTRFMDYLTDVRISRAKELIGRGGYALKELAEKVGNRNHTYFCKIFKKLTGMTVGEYRCTLENQHT